MNILLIGSGGREHAIAWALQKSPNTDVLYVAPGNGGTAEIAENVDLDIADGEALLSFVHERNIGLVVIGPEAPLVAGVADVLREAGVAGTIRFLCLVSAPEGIERLLAADDDLIIYTCAIDDGLNENAYIVPGLGDAGDRIFGTE